MSEVRATASVLFTDMVGSTALRSRLGEGAADELRRRHDAAMDWVVSAKRGRLVKSTGDGIMATFDSAADAVEAGVEAQQAIVSLSRELGIEDLAIRIGVSAGDVSWSEHDCSGLPVVEAARLEQAAEAGQVLCSEIVRMLARGRAQVGFERIGELTLKGLEDPLLAYEVPWSVADIDSGGSADGRGPFAGRPGALATMAEVFGAARDGAGGCVLVAGEPGVGKTRLVTEALAKQSGAGAAWGRSYASEAMVLGPVVELIDDLVDRDPERLRTSAAHHGPVLGELSGRARAAWSKIEAPERLDLADQRQRLHSAITDTMAAWAAVEPLVVVFDDLHWADELSVSVFRALARRAVTSPLVVIGTYRHTDLDRLHPLGEALPLLARETSPTQIDLGGLDEDEVAIFVSELAGTEIDPAFIGEITAVTAGNPLFVGEIARHLAETGAVARDDDGAWRPVEGAAIDIPRGVRQVIGGRIGRLDEDTQAFLAVASGFGGPFPLTTAAVVVGVSESLALDHVDAAVAAGLVEASGEFDVFDFTHALVRQTLYDEAGPSRQVRLHRRIAEAMEVQLVGEPTGSVAASLVRHYHRSAVMPGSEDGVRWAAIAADAALDDAAFSDAANFVDIAAELAKTATLPPSLLVIRAEAAAALGDSEATVRACSAAAAVLGDIETASLHARCVLNLIDAGVDFAEVWDLATIGVGFCGDRRDDDWLVLRNYQLDGEEVRSPDYRGIPLESAERQELLDVSVRTGSSVRLSVLFPNRAAILAHPNPPAHNFVTLVGDFRTAAGRYEAILADAINHGLAGQEIEARGYLLRVLDALGEHEQAVEVLEGGVDVFRRFPMSLQGGRYLASILIFGAGRGFSAETPWPVSHPDFPSTITAGDWLDLMLAATTGRGDHPGGDKGTFLVPRAVAHGALALGVAWLGDPKRAVSILEEVLPTCLEAPAGADEAPSLPSSFVESLILAGEIRWVDEIRRMAAKIVTADFHGSLSCARDALGQLEARLGNRGTALEWFDRSRQARIAQGAIPRVALVDVHEAEAELLLGGPRDKILRLIDAARPALERGGYLDWLADCDRIEAAS